MIAYIYRPKRQRNGKLISSRIWRAQLKLTGDVKARDISLGLSDKQVAEQKLRDKAIEKIDEKHEESLAVTAGHENGNGGERGIRTSAHHALGIQDVALIGFEDDKNCGEGVVCEV